ncbi:cardiotrophin-1 isoform X2 [Rhinoderma darwinii]|uniref:cardiotrophin-1 isoform X2 n=1 Tax=Rhinoderma darwinii TaxID=43563 RepID=UPI003F668D1B
MELITGHRAEIQDEKWQALLLVSKAKSEADKLVEKYLSQQGPPFSDNGAAVPQSAFDNLPALDQNGLSSSPWNRLTLSLRAFSSLNRWFSSVLLWQRSLNPKAKELLILLEIAERNSRAISSNLAALLELQDLSSTSLTLPSTTLKKKVAGYMVCKTYYEWLSQTERDLSSL